MASPTVLHLRSETKPLEHRAAITPTAAQKLVDAGYEVHVERNPPDGPKRIFGDDEYTQADARIKLVPSGSWVDADPSHIIVGLKELEEAGFPLQHTHVQFAHCYKGQAGWDQVLKRFVRGGGTLLDLEFLVNDQGQRVAAFGKHAGFAGAALALKTWAWQQTNPGQALGSLEPYENEGLLVSDVKAALKRGGEKAGRTPRVVVIGALGRCGKGAVEALQKCGIPDENILKWDMEETKPGGPFKEITDRDVFVNCIYLTSKIPHFVNFDSLKAAGADRRLSVVCDVSADTTNPNNPIPIYTIATTFDKPTAPVDGLHGGPLHVISIDHLPSLLPREASEQFSADLLPSLLELKNRHKVPSWVRAAKLFQEKVATLDGPKSGQI